MSHAEYTRRSVLGASSLALVSGLAGCSSGGDGNGDTDVPTPSGRNYSDLHEWLTETETGPAPDNYNGGIADRRDSDSVTVDVGASGNGGNFAYAPAAVLVSAGTEIRWSWTGAGNPHNVEADPEEQLGLSDYEFSSGDAEGGSGVKYTRTLEDPGIALYHCEPHLSLGMKGGIAVE